MPRTSKIGQALAKTLAETLTVTFNKSYETMCELAGFPLSDEKPPSFIDEIFIMHLLSCVQSTAFRERVEYRSDHADEADTELCDFFWRAINPLVQKASDGRVVFDMSPYYVMALELLVPAWRRGNTKDGILFKYGCPRGGQSFAGDELYLLHEEYERYFWLDCIPEAERLKIGDSNLVAHIAEMESRVKKNAYDFITQEAKKFLWRLCCDGKVNCVDGQKSVLDAIRIRDNYSPDGMRKKIELIIQKAIAKGRKGGIFSPSFNRPVIIIGDKAEIIESTNEKFVPELNKKLALIQLKQQSYKDVIKDNVFFSIRLLLDTVIERLEKQEQLGGKQSVKSLLDMELLAEICKFIRDELNKKDRTIDAIDKMLLGWMDKSITFAQPDSVFLEKTLLADWEKLFSTLGLYAYPHLAVPRLLALVQQSYSMESALRGELEVIDERIGALEKAMDKFDKEKEQKEHKAFTKMVRSLRGRTATFFGRLNALSMGGYYPILLTSVPAGQEVTVEQMYLLSRNAIPVLIKIGSDVSSSIFIYGNSGGTEWKLTQFDSAVCSTLPFPLIGQPACKIEAKDVDYEVYQSISSARGHVGGWEQCKFFNTPPSFFRQTFVPTESGGFEKLMSLTSTFDVHPPVTSYSAPEGKDGASKVSPPSP